MVQVDHTWLPPPTSISLSHDEVHVWRAGLAGPESYADKMRRLLSPDELYQAARFHFPRYRQRFIVGRGILRIILSRYLHLPPGQVQFTYMPHGKPVLASPADQLSFNLSH